MYKRFPVDKDIFNFFNEIKTKVGTSWIHIHVDVVRKLEQDESFDSYRDVKRVEKDGNWTNLTRLSFRKENGDFFRIWLKACEMMEDEPCYYIVYMLRCNDIGASAPSEPKEVIFFK